MPPLGLAGTEVSTKSLSSVFFQATCPRPGGDAEVVTRWTAASFNDVCKFDWMCSPTLLPPSCSHGRNCICHWDLPRDGAMIGALLNVRLTFYGYFAEMKTRPCSILILSMFSLDVRDPGQVEGTLRVTALPDGNRLLRQVAREGLIH